MKLKFCGIRRMEDVTLMNEFLPDYIGYIFAESKRKISPEAAAILSEALNKRIQKVGVFVDAPQKEIAQTAKTAALDVIQLHGNEGADMVAELRRLLPHVEIWKAVRVQTPEDIKKAQELSCDRLLLDSFSLEAAGGTGKVAKLSAIKESGASGFFLAGGLNAGNITEILKEMRPYGADISSGIEQNGFKSRQKILEIMRCLNCLE